MIEFKNVSKQYDSKLALDNLNLTINDGEIFGLIGHNGAGKSTAIKALTSIIEVSNGDILFDNMNLRENRLECKKQIGYVPDSPDIFLTLSPYEYWSLIANLYELDEKTTEERIYEYSKLFNMIGVEHQEINSFSHGMRQKVFLIAALLSNPRFWIMDEPISFLLLILAFTRCSAIFAASSSENFIPSSSFINSRAFNPIPYSFG